LAVLPSQRGRWIMYSKQSSTFAILYSVRCFLYGYTAYRLNFACRRTVISSNRGARAHHTYNTFAVKAALACPLRSDYAPILQYI
jgi:hypothetical protein